MAEVSREKIQKYVWLNRYVNANGPEKVELSSTFAKTLMIAKCMYVCITYANPKEKKLASGNWTT